MKKGAKLQDVENGMAVYLAGPEVHVLKIADNSDRVVAHPEAARRRTSSRWVSTTPTTSQKARSAAG